jgi:hypothetical protein
MARGDDVQDAKRLRAWQDDQRLFFDCMVHVIGTAPRCTVGSCACVAYWSEQRGHRFDMQCDAHKGKGAGELAGSDVVRRVIARVQR